MNLSEALQKLYPDASPLRDYSVADSGQGAYIAVWNLPTKRPSKAILAALGVIEGRKVLSAVREWADLNRALLDKAQDIIDAMARPRRLRLANAIPDLIKATPDREEVGDSGLTRERALSIDTMFLDFERWLDTPLPDVKLTPIQVLSSRED